MVLSLTVKSFWWSFCTQHRQGGCIFKNNEIHLKYPIVYVNLTTFIFFELSRSVFAFVPSNSVIRNLGTSPRTSVGTGIEIYDELLSDTSRVSVDYEIRNCDIGHSVYQLSKTPRNSVESTIRSILKCLDDTSEYVEYWRRDEWISLEMHRDVDEKLASSSSRLICPQNGHVLYLDIGSLVYGPTVLLSDEDIESPNGLAKKFVIVPAINGRLVRFSGNMMHAVPRPGLAYLDPEEGGTNTEVWTRIRNPDKNSDLFKSYRRSVLLFNTWKESPPLNVPLEPPVASIQGHNHRLGNEVCHLGVAIGKLGDISCKPFEEWKRVEIAHIPSSSGTESGGRAVRLKIGLLGDRQRRERADRYVNLFAPPAVKQGLLDARGPPTSYEVCE